MEFSSHYHQLAQESQRSAPVPERMPSLRECDDMMVLQSKISTALSRIRETVLEQQHVLADQHAREQSCKAQGDYDVDEGSMYSEDMKNQGYVGSDAKKRRGVCGSLLVDGISY